MRKRKMIEEK